MTQNTKKSLDLNDPSTWPDPKIATALEPVRRENRALAEYMRRAEFRVERQKNLMRLVVSLLRQRHVALIDLEATCFNDPAEDARQSKEVIEIGWALLDTATLTVVDKQQLYVKPTTSYVSAFCTELTGIRPEQVANALTFPEAMHSLRQLHEAHSRGPVTVWGSFGEYDRKQLERQCLAESIAYPLNQSRHFNLKESSAAFFGFGKKSPGLARSVTLAGLQFEGQHHSGVDDAVNAARILGHILGMTINEE